MASDRTEEIRDALDRLYAHLDDVQQDTRQKLVSDALHIVDFHANNWIDILSWIRSKYTREEQMNIFMLHFLRIFKEIYWLELFLLNANYPMIHSNLRYIWEMICQAYYVDTHHAGLTLDEQVEEAKEIEEKKLYGWNIVQHVLCEVFGECDVESDFHPMWIRLCRHVHPSPWNVRLCR
jgi:hypothetical protein